MTKSEIEVGLTELRIGQKYIVEKLDKIELQTQGLVTRKEFTEHVKKDAVSESAIEKLHTRVDNIELHIKTSKAKYSIPMRLIEVVVTALVVALVSFFFSKII